jgi:uncharacterized protein (DUF433 family)
VKGRSSFDPAERRFLPAYTPVQAAVYLRLPVATVRAWAVGQQRHGEHPGFFKPVIEAQRHHGKLAFSFVNLVELHVLSALRRVHDVPLPKIRKSLDYLRRHYGGIRNPLADLDLLTDGLDLWLDELGSFVSLSGEGQTGIREVLEAHLRRVDREPTGRAVRLFPFIRSVAPADEPRTVMIDPEVSFGRPVLVGTGIPTRAIADRFNAGDTIHALAEDYDRPPEEIEEAIRWERRPERAA